MTWITVGRGRGALFQACALVFMTATLGCGFRAQPKSGTVACQPQKGSCCPEGYLCVGRGLSTMGGPSAGVCWDKGELPPEALTNTHDYTPGVISDPPCQVTDWLPPELGGVASPDAANSGPDIPPVGPGQPGTGPVGVGDAGTAVFDVGGAVDPFLAAQASSIAAGYNRSYAVVNGALWRWGGTWAPGSMQLPDEVLPILVWGLETGVTAVFSGEYVTCAVAGGLLWCWGLNLDGELGDGTNISQTGKTLPVVGLSSGITAVTPGFHHTCAVVNGGAWCWGDNIAGQLGNGSSQDSNVPVQVSGLESGVTAISVGEYFSCALVNGRVRCWGEGTFGVLGNGKRESQRTPVEVVGLSGVTALASYRRHSCAVVNRSSIQCWGNNEHGELGNGNKKDSPVPVQVVGLTGEVTGLAASWQHTCAIVNGAARCWGADYPRILGGPIPAGEVASHVQGLDSGVLAIVTGFAHNCVRLANGVKCWGQNEYGQLGIGTKVAPSTPGAVSPKLPE